MQRSGTLRRRPARRTSRLTLTGVDAGYTSGASSTAPAGPLSNASTTQQHAPAPARPWGASQTTTASQRSVVSRGTLGSRSSQHHLRSNALLYNYPSGLSPGAVSTAVSMEPGLPLQPQQGNAPAGAGAASEAALLQQMLEAELGQRAFPDPLTRPQLLPGTATAPPGQQQQQQHLMRAPSTRRAMLRSTTVHEGRGSSSGGGAATYPRPPRMSAGGASDTHASSPSATASRRRRSTGGAIMATDSSASVTAQGNPLPAWQQQQQQQADLAAGGVEEEGSGVRGPEGAGAPAASLVAGAATGVRRGFHRMWTQLSRVVETRGASGSSSSQPSASNTNTTASAAAAAVAAIDGVAPGAAEAAGGEAAGLLPSEGSGARHHSVLLQPPAPLPAVPEVPAASDAHAADAEHVVLHVLTDEASGQQQQQQQRPAAAGPVAEGASSEEEEEGRRGVGGSSRRPPNEQSSSPGGGGGSGHLHQTESERVPSGHAGGGGRPAAGEDAADRSGGGLLGALVGPALRHMRARSEVRVLPNGDAGTSPQGEEPPRSARQQSARHHQRAATVSGSPDGRHARDKQQGGGASGRKGGGAGGESGGAASSGRHSTSAAGHERGGIAGRDSVGGSGHPPRHQHSRQTSDATSSNALACESSSAGSETGAGLSNCRA